MSSFWKISRVFWLTCSLGAGCAATHGTQPAAPAVTDPPVRSALETAAISLPAPAGWGPRFPPRLLRDLNGTDELTGEVASLPMGYVFHRIDVEKIRVLRMQQASCSTDLEACEHQVAELTATPSFWNRQEGRMLLIGLGFVAGTGATVGIAVAVGR